MSVGDTTLIASSVRPSFGSSPTASGGLDTSSQAAPFQCSIKPAEGVVSSAVGRYSPTAQTSLGPTAATAFSRTLAPAVSAPSTTVHARPSQCSKSAAVVPGEPLRNLVPTAQMSSDVTADAATRSS